MKTKISILLLLAILLTACLPTSGDAQKAADATVQALVSTEMAKLTPTATSQSQVQPTQTPVIVVVTATNLPATVAPIVENTLATVSETTKSNDWVITWLSAASLDRGDGTTFRQDAEKWTWRKIAPELWPTFPNEPNPLVPDFRVVNGNEVPDGLENAMDESNFCQQLVGEACRYPVAAGHYLFYSGDYSDVPQLGSCVGTEDFGCEMVIVNVGDVSSDFTSVFQQGFRLHARYFNGDTLNMGVWALMSNGASNMMNLFSPLNKKGQTNAGANCSVKTGCPGVDARVLFVSGNEPLLMLTTQVSRP